MGERKLCSVESPAVFWDRPKVRHPGSRICLFWPLFWSLHRRGTCSFCFRVWAQFRQLSNWFMSFIRNFFSLKLATWSQIAGRDSVPPISVLLCPMLRRRWGGGSSGSVLGMALNGYRVGALVYLDGRTSLSTSSFTNWEGYWWQRASGIQPLPSFLLYLTLRASCFGVWLIKELFHCWRGFGRGQVGKDVS